MQVAIVGAGFTGLTAGLRLQQKGHQVTIFEKESELGGLAVGFSNPKWDWTLERAYHHWFTNDKAVLNLAKELKHKVVIKRPNTDVFLNDKIYPFDSTKALLKFEPLSIGDRLRMGFSLLYLKLTNDYKKFESKKAFPWIKQFMGQKATNMIWEPLFKGKFGPYKGEISLSWFWARIKKRTPKLVYPKGGFKVFADKLGEEIKKIGGIILTETFVESIRKNDNKIEIKVGQKKYYFDRVIVTLPSPIFAKITHALPKTYIKKICSIIHSHALILMLVLKKPFLKKTYWLNITDKSFPFLILAEHTNFMHRKHYGGQHILYIGNYLQPNHPYLKMTKKKLLKIFDPFLKKINSSYQLSLIDYHKFFGPFAQPIVTTDYSKLIPTFATPLKNIYLANLDMVYPWDRGTNYAVEMGEEIAQII